LSLDFSFLQAFEGTSEKMRNLDSSSFSKWVSTAQDLMNFNENDFQDFVGATDELFNEIENVLGMGPEGLDHVADFFSDQVGNFLSTVQEKITSFEENPIADIKPPSINVPSILSDVKREIRSNFEEFVNKQFSQLVEDFQEKQKSDFQNLFKIIEQYLQPEEEKKNAPGMISTAV